MRRVSITSRTLLLAFAAQIISPHIGLANGRFPATVDIRFQAGSESKLLVPATFGLLLSNDDGASFRWVCEEAIGYGGTYDPDYAVAANGTIYATTFAGLRFSDDGGCSWREVAGPFSGKWVGEVEVATDQVVWATTSTGNTANDVYKSVAGGPFQSVGLLRDDVWWLTVQPAPSPASTVYVSGFVPGGVGETSSSLLARTKNGGDTWSELPTNDFDLDDDSQILIEAVSPTDPNVVFARVLRARKPLGDDIYRTLDGGQTWERILSMPGEIRAFHLRKDGKAVIAGIDSPCDGSASELEGCVVVAPNAGLPGTPKWEKPQSQPRAACFAENENGALFSCAANWEPDEFALGTSLTGQEWNKVMQFSQIVGPLACPEETIQARTCAKLRWADLCEQLSICNDTPRSVAVPETSGCDHGASHGLGLCLLGLIFIVGFSRRLRD